MFEGRGDISDQNEHREVLNPGTFQKECQAWDVPNKLGRVAEMQSECEGIPTCSNLLHAVGVGQPCGYCNTSSM